MESKIKNMASPNFTGSTADTLYAAVGGEEMFDRIIHGFYSRMREDDLIGPMYPQDDWEGAEQRLRLFLIQYWGGPHTYNELRGHPRLRMRHMPFSIGTAERDRWLEIMQASLDDIPEEDLPHPYRAAMWNHMEQVANMVINQMR